MATDDHVLRVFVSSPGDVEEERLIAQRVLKRLADRFSRVVKIEPIFWEHEPLVATEGFQPQIASPAETDIVVCILWARIGTRLPPSIRRRDGSTYASGTEYEFETAVEGHRQRGQPDLLVYRKQAQPDSKPKSSAEALTFAEQWQALDAFVAKWFHGEDGTLLAAFHSFVESAGFEQILEVHLRKLIERRLSDWGVSPDVNSLSSPASWTSGSPFRGLEVFEFEHAPIFFGRTKAVSEVLTALRRQAYEGRAFLLIVGGSGSGKSSLVRAGVLPMLTQPGVIEGIGLWRRAIMRPAAASASPTSSSGKSGDLFDALAVALADPAALPELVADGTPVERLAEMLRKSPSGAYGLVKGALSEAAATVKPAKEAKSRPEARLVLVVDQLEEIFSDKRFTPAGREALFVALGDLARSGKVWVIATLRSDFYHRCQEIPDLVSLKGAEGQLDLSPPETAEIGQMIRQPATAAGLEFDFDPQTGQSLDNILQNEAGTIKEGLPLLEFALDELYRQTAGTSARANGSTPAGRLVLKFTDYRGLKGLAGCLAERAEKTFDALDAGARGSFAQVFRKLVVLDGTERPPTRRVAPMTEFEHDPALVRFVDRFVTARLFTADRAVGPTGGATVRIAHEALLTTAEWKTLRDWLAADRENLQMHGRLAAAASRWSESQRTADLLLQPGKPLDEARQLLAAQFELSATERALIEASEREARWQSLVRRVAIGSLAALTVATAIAACFAVLNARQAVKNAIRADSNAVRAERSLVESECLLVGDAYRAWQAGDVESAWRDLNSCNVDFRGWEYQFLFTLFTKNQQTLKGHRNWVASVAFSPDGKRIASAGFDSTVKVWDVDSGREVLSFKRHTAPVWSVAFSPNGAQIASASGDRTIKVWNSSTGDAIHTLKGQGGPVLSVAFSPDGKWIVGGTKEGAITIWDSSSDKAVRTIKAHFSSVWGLAFSPDGKRIVSGSADTTVKVWDAATGQGTATLEGHTGEVTSAAFSPDGKQIVSGSQDHTIKVWNISSGREAFTLIGHSAGVASVALSPDGRRIASGSSDKTIKMWSASSGEQLFTLLGHDAELSSVAFSPDGKRLVSGSKDKTVKVWDAVLGQEPLTLNGKGSASSLAFSPDGSRVASASGEHSIKVWLTSSGRELLTLKGHSEPVHCVAYSPDGSLLASGSEDQSIKLWETTSGREVRSLKRHTDTVQSLAFSPDGTRIVSGSLDKTVGIWDTPSGQNLAMLRGHEGPISGVAFSPDGKKILSGSWDGTIKLWDLSASWELLTLARNSERVESVAFSPDGRWIAGGGWDRTISIWDAASGQKSITLKGADDEGERVESVMFSPDSKRLVSGQRDGKIKIWETSVGREILAIKAHSAPIVGLAFSPDAKQLVSECSDGTIKVWNASSR
jgi:WD40 repeat protein